MKAGFSGEEEYRTTAPRMETIPTHIETTAKRPLIRVDLGSAPIAPVFATESPLKVKLGLTAHTFVS